MEAARSRLARRRRRGHLLREDGERCLQAVRQVAGLRHRARDAALALVEQRVEVVDERRDLGRILALEPRRPPVANGAEPFAQRREWRQSAPDDRQSRGDEHTASAISKPL